MAASGDRHRSPLAQLKALIGRLPAWLSEVDDSDLGDELVGIRESVVQLEAAFAGGLRRFDKSGEYKADGAVSLIDWLRWKAKLSGGAAMERVTIARQLEQLPQTRQAFASGDVGYQHVALLARTAEKVGAAAVKGEEASLLKAAGTMDPGGFAEVTRAFEYRVDHAAALAEANRAFARRYLHISDVKDGLVHLEGLLDAEGSATLKTALGALMPPPRKDDDRTPGQRRADAMVELARRQQTWHRRWPAAAPGHHRQRRGARRTSERAARTTGRRRSDSHRDRAAPRLRRLGELATRTGGAGERDEPCAPADPRAHPPRAGGSRS